MTSEPITRLLDAARGGDPDASNALFSAVYGELQKLAGSHRRRWRGNETMSTTALIHAALRRNVPGVPPCLVATPLLR